MLAGLFDVLSGWRGFYSFLFGLVLLAFGATLAAVEGEQGEAPESRLGKLETRKIPNRKYKPRH